MLIYMSLDILIILFGLLFMKAHVKVGNRVISGRACFFVVAAVLLIFISAFRGNFTTDYDHYIDIYNIYAGSSMVSILRRGYFTSPETGYVLFQHIIGLIFHNPLYIFIVSSIVIVLGNLYHLKKYSDDLLLGVLLFVEAGIYFTSFNLMRQCLAATIIVMGSRFLYERKTWNYLLIILFASTFHVSSLIMIPFYYFSTFKIKKNLILYFFIVLFFAVSAPIAAHFIQNYFWSWHKISDGYSWKNIVLPTSISLFTFVSYCINNIKSNESNRSNILKNSKAHCKTKEILNNETYSSVSDINNIWLNATIIYLTFVLLGMWFSLASRFSTFFSIYVLCFFANQIRKGKYRKIFTVGTIVMLVLYGYVTKIGDFPYYFVWNR